MFAKPTGRRLLKSALAVVLVCWAVASTTVCVGFIANHEGDPMSTGEVVRLAMMCLVFWGPIAIITLWPVSIPLIAGLSAFVAYAQSRDSRYLTAGRGAVCAEGNTDA
ncbi:hypothetical protein [Mycolicibacterium goodii]|uniref:hypothetical protein n=1 Tax=Mycolicibacterium goodii TaxID=134601 RepID=UPI0006732D7A